MRLDSCGSLILYTQFTYVVMFKERNSILGAIRTGDLCLFYTVEEKILGIAPHFVKYGRI